MVMNRGTINIYIKLVCLKVGCINAVLYISLYNITEPIYNITIVETIEFCTYGKGILIAIKKVIDIYETKCTTLNIYSTLDSTATFIKKYKDVIKDNNIQLVSNLNNDKLCATKVLLTCLLNRPKDISKVNIIWIQKDQEYKLLNNF